MQQICASGFKEQQSVDYQELSGQAGCEFISLVW
jgi:hypothetical protein